LRFQHGDFAERTKEETLKTLISILIIALSFSVSAKEKTKSKAKAAVTTQDEDKPKVEPVPGGARADHEFYKRWEDSIRHQKFEQLPHSSVLLKDKDQIQSDERKRYIFQLDTAAIDLKNEIWDEGYYHYAYSTKEQGDYLLQVHPKYRKCFDDLKKKFDFMQWVVFPHGDIVGRKVIRLEAPRQCLGDIKESTGARVADFGSPLGTQEEMRM